MDGIRMAKEDKTKDRLIRAVKKSRYTIHDHIPGVAFVEMAGVNGLSSEVETLIRVDEGYEVISFSKINACDIYRDKSGRLKCTCYLRKPCKHLLAVREVEVNNIMPPTLQDMMGEMIDIERS